MFPGVSTTHASLLLRLGQGGDSAAWQEFFDRYVDLLRGFARRRGLQATDADDVVQDVMLAIRKQIGEFRYDPGRGRFRGFLKTLALRAIWPRLYLDHAATAEGSAVADIERDAAFDAEWEEEWRQYHLKTAMQRIRHEFNASDVRAFELYAGEGRDPESTGRSLGLSIDQVYQAKSRIVRRLKQLIAEQVAEEG